VIDLAQRSASKPKQDHSKQVLHQGSNSKIFFSGVDVDGGEGVIGADEEHPIEVDYYPKKAAAEEK